MGTSSHQDVGTALCALSPALEAVGVCGTICRASVHASHTCFGRARSVSTMQQEIGMQVSTPITCASWHTLDCMLQPGTCAPLQVQRACMLAVRACVLSGGARPDKQQHGQVSRRPCMHAALHLVSERKTHAAHPCVLRHTAALTCTPPALRRPRCAPQTAAWPPAPAATRGPAAAPYRPARGGAPAPAASAWLSGPCHPRPWSSPRR